MLEDDSRIADEKKISYGNYILEKEAEQKKKESRTAGAAEDPKSEKPYKDIIYDTKEKVKGKTENFPECVYADVAEALASDIVELRKSIKKDSKLIEEYQARINELMESISSRNSKIQNYSKFISHIGYGDVLIACSKE